MGNKSENPPEAFSEDGRKLGTQHCSCGYKFDCASDVEENNRPRPGDFTLCLNCGEIFVFDENMRCNQPTIDEIKNLDAKTWNLLERAQRLIREKRPLSRNG